MTDRTGEKNALAFGLAAVLLWSTVATGFKLGLAVLAAEQLLLLGTAISWLVFATAVAWQRNFRLSRDDLALSIVLGLINPWGYYLILFAAYDRLPAHIAQPLNYTWAIVLALLAVPMLKQRLTKRVLVGIFTSYAGVAMLLGTAANDGAGSWDVPGVALALSSTALWAIYWLLTTRSNSNPVSMIFVSFTVGLPLVLLTCLLGPGLPALNLETAGYGAWVGLVEMGITFLLWQQALKRTRNAANVGQLIFLSPFLSLVMVHFVLGETITASAIGSLAMITAGIAIAQRATA